jgi:hypothetical protein
MDQEVHASAGREAGATSSLALQIRWSYKLAGATGSLALQVCWRYRFAIHRHCTSNRKSTLYQLANCSKKTLELQEA